MTNTSETRFNRKPTSIMNIETSEEFFYISTKAAKLTIYFAKMAKDQYLYGSIPRDEYTREERIISKWIDAGMKCKFMKFDYKNIIYFCKPEDLKEKRSIEFFDN